MLKTYNNSHHDQNKTQIFHAFVKKRLIIKSIEAIGYQDM